MIWHVHRRADNSDAETLAKALKAVLYDGWRHGGKDPRAESRCLQDRMAGAAVNQIPPTAGARAMKIRPHTMNDLDRYGPMAKLPLSLSSPVWAGADITAADVATLQAHFRDTIAPLIEAKCSAAPAVYLEILAALRAHLFDEP